MLKTSIIVDKYLGYLKCVYKKFDENFLLIKKACDVAKVAHEGEYRKLTGNPFIAHPMRVAVMVAEKTDDLSLILAAILHDVVEDASDKFPMEYIYKEFGNDVGFLVDSVTDNILYYFENPKIKFKDKSDKFLYGVIKNTKCAFLKLMDREHNNKTLDGLKTDKQIRKSFETQALYNPLKKILKVGQKDFILEDIDKLLHEYMSKKGVFMFDDLRSALYKETFEDIDSDNFNLFYYSSDSIVWNIEDKSMLEELINIKSFDEKIEIISLSEDGAGNFSCLFKYKGGQVFDDNFKLKISSFTN